MEFEERNKRPQEASKNLPMAVLITLVGVVCLLLYVGWQMISDDASNASELKPVAAETTTAEPEELDLENGEAIDAEPVPEEVVTAEQPKEAKAPEAKAKKIAGAKTATHSIQKGETMFSIASRYNLSPETLQAYNPNISVKSLNVGAKLTIPVMAIHVVSPGDILRVVGGKYGVTVEALMKANGKTKNFAARGEKLIIPFKDKK